MKQKTINMSHNKATILGVSINSSELAELLREIGETASKNPYRSERTVGGAKNPDADNSQPLIVFTPNPEFLVEAERDHEFRDLLNKADINLPDGIGLIWAGKLLGQPIKERISGADMVERLLEIGNREQETVNNHERWTIGIVGARRGVVGEVKQLFEELSRMYPNVCFVNLDNKSGVQDGKWECEVRSESGSGSVKWVIDKKTHPHFSSSTHITHPTHTSFNVIFAAHGVKKQESWIWENKDKFKTNLVMGVGGSLDFLTDFSKRAPKIIQHIGLEWLWRGLYKPSHFKRIYKATILFGWLVIKQVLGDSG